MKELALVINLSSLDFKDHFKCSQIKDLLRIRFFFVRGEYVTFS